MSFDYDKMLLMRFFDAMLTPESTDASLTLMPLPRLSI